MFSQSQSISGLGVETQPERVLLNTPLPKDDVDTLRSSKLASCDIIYVYIFVWVSMKSSSSSFSHPFIAIFPPFNLSLLRMSFHCDRWGEHQGWGPGPWPAPWWDWHLEHRYHAVPGGGTAGIARGSWMSVWMVFPWDPRRLVILKSHDVSDIRWGWFSWSLMEMGKFTGFQIHDIEERVLISSTCCFKGEIGGFEGFEHGQTHYIYGLKNLRPRQDRRTQIWNAAGHARMWQSGSVHRLRGSDMSHCFAEFCRHKSVSKCGKTWKNIIWKFCLPRKSMTSDPLTTVPYCSHGHSFLAVRTMSCLMRWESKVARVRSWSVPQALVRWLRLMGGLSVGLPKNASIYGDGSAEKGWSPTGIWGAAGSVSIHQKVGGQRAKAATERNGKNESKAKSEQRAELKANRTWEESNLQRKWPSSLQDFERLRHTHRATGPYIASKVFVPLDTRA